MFEENPFIYRFIQIKTFPEWKTYQSGSNKLVVNLMVSLNVKYIRDIELILHIKLTDKSLNTISSLYTLLNYKKKS